jgi:hypothetical protein
MCKRCPWKTVNDVPERTLKIEGTKVSVALICFKDFGFLPWVPEVPKVSDQSPIPPACLLPAIRCVPINYRDGQ